jgi:hypothetical protein
MREPWETCQQAGGERTLKHTDHEGVGDSEMRMNESVIGGGAALYSSELARIDIIDWRWSRSGTDN